jgi:cytochrome c5
MGKHSRSGRPSPAVASSSRWLLAAAALALAGLAGPAQAQGGGRSGEQVVASACASCHTSGERGAPKIGDQKAWSARAARGLTALTQEALQGIRQMPAHGGSPGLSDKEIERAITTMVNQSGGKWIEPTSKAFCVHRSRCLRDSHRVSRAVHSNCRYAVVRHATVAKSSR